MVTVLGLIVNMITKGTYMTTSWHENDNEEDIHHMSSEYLRQMSMGMIWICLLSRMNLVVSYHTRSGCIEKKLSKNVHLTTFYLNNVINSLTFTYI